MASSVFGVMVRNAGQATPDVIPEGIAQRVCQLKVAGRVVEVKG
jgi:hypothetical protein